MFMIHAQALQFEKVSRFCSITVGPKRKTIVWASVTIDVIQTKPLQGPILKHSYWDFTVRDIILQLTN